MWSSPKNITTENAKFLPRFQLLCEEFGLKPTYVANYEMAMSSEFVQFGLGVVKKNTGEIGMHLHAWHSPPYSMLTDDDSLYQPYLIEYPVNVIEEKIDVMTRLLEDTFQTKMVSHRSGRWAFDKTYAQILEKRGYLVDCSVAPYVSFKSHIGDPSQNGGTDFTCFPHNAYFLDLNNISQKGQSKLLEIPMTIRVQRHGLKSILQKSIGSSSLGEKVINKFCPTYRLRPNGSNLEKMKSLITQVINEKEDYVEFMLHSSEFMPGGSQTFKTAESIEKLYEDLRQLFAYIQNTCQGATLKEYYEYFSKKNTHDITP